MYVVSDWELCIFSSIELHAAGHIALSKRVGLYWRGTYSGEWAAPTEMSDLDVTKAVAQVRTQQLKRQRRLQKN
jgi:hypothetical protein